VLEAVRVGGGVRVVVNVTSDKCYDNREWDWGYREYEPKGGHDPYSNSKGCAELVTDAYRRSFFAVDGETRLASARAGNVVGGGDWGQDRLIPDIMRGALAGEPILIRNPEAIRPWQHVLNPLSGYLLLAQALWDDATLADGWNFGPADEDARPVRWITERLAQLWPEELDWRVDDGPHPHEARYLKLDSSRARNSLDWAPGWNLSQALDAIVEWYRAHKTGADMRELTLGQIEAFHYASAPR
jgi:CDP-glucose 4,6-dehydratase